MDQLTIIPGATPEQQQAVAMHYEIVEAARQTANSLLELGRKLKRMKDSGLYKTLGYESFGDYTEQAVGIRQRQAYNYISVVESLPARLIEENAAAGVTKLALLSKLGPEDREEVAGDLANITVKQLEQLIAEKSPWRSSFLSSSRRQKRSRSLPRRLTPKPSGSRYAQNSRQNSRPTTTRRSRQCRLPQSRKLKPLQERPRKSCARPKKI